MKINKKQDDQVTNVSENKDQSVASRAWKKSLKTTAVTSVFSLALFGASQIPMQALLGGADSPVQAQSRNQDDRALRTYFNRGFNYADAKVLASYWGGSIGDSKVRMGYKLMNLRSKDALAFIREARGLALERSRVYTGRGQGYISYPINYTDGGYQYRDAEALSSYWRKDVGETKLLMETMLMSGKDQTIKAALRNARR